jgi:Fe2+ or Zn2+ uptake regulation protein
MTKNYRLVYDIVREQTRGAHLAPADVFTLAKKKRQGIGFTTVYRALARLRKLGLVSEISVPGADSSYYEAAGPAHAHFRCEACGAIEDIDYALDSNIVNEIAHKHAIAVRDVSLSLRGKCRRCTDRVESPVS